MPDNLSKAHESMAAIDFTFSSDDLLVWEEEEKERLRGESIGDVQVRECTNGVDVG